MAQTALATCRDLLAILNISTGREYTLERMNGGYRLMDQRGRPCGPPLSPASKKLWLEAFIDGINHERATHRCPQPRGGSAMG